MVSRIVGIGLLIIIGLPLAIAFPPLAIAGGVAWFVTARKRAERNAAAGRWQATQGWQSAPAVHQPRMTRHQGRDSGRRQGLGSEFPFLMIVVVMFSLVGMAARQPQFLTVPVLIVAMILVFKMFGNRPDRRVTPLFEPQPAMAASAAPSTPRPAFDPAPAPIASSTPPPGAKSFQSLSSAEFEQRVTGLLRTAGYQHTQHVGEAGRQGIDFITRDRNGHLFLVQVQQYAPGDRAGSIDMQELIDAVIEEKAAGGIFVTTATFTQAAINLAQYARVPIVLYDGAALHRLAARPQSRSWSAA